MQTTKRLKRAARACDHCKHKRLKCTVQDNNNSCTNCQSYATECKYSSHGNIGNSTSAAKRKPARVQQSSDGNNTTKRRGERNAEVEVEEEGGDEHQQKEGGTNPAAEQAFDQPSRDTRTMNRGYEHDGTSIPAETPRTPAAMAVDDDQAAGALPTIPDLPEIDLQHASVSSSLPTPASDTASELGEYLLHRAVSARFKNEGQKADQRSRSRATHEQKLERKMFKILNALLTGSLDPSTSAFPIARASLITQSLASCSDDLISDYFECVNPLYPVVDEGTFRRQVRVYNTSKRIDDTAWPLLYKLVIVLGAMASSKQGANGPEKISLAEHLFWEVLSSVHMLFAENKLLHVQIMVMKSLVFLLRKRISTAWVWCRMAFTSLKARGRGNINGAGEPYNRRMEDRLLWVFTVLESNLTLQRSEDNPLVHESSLKPPDRDFQDEFPIFCTRLRLARLINRFSAIFQEGTLNPSQLTDMIDEIDNQLEKWTNMLPLNHRPGNDILAEDREYQFVILSHLEYYGLTMAMFSALQDAAILFPTQVVLKSHKSLRIRNASQMLVQNARAMFRTFNALSDTSHLKPNVSDWLNPTLILSGASILYSHIVRKASLHSSRVDLQLLSCACHHLNYYMTDSLAGQGTSNLLSLMLKTATEVTLSYHAPSLIGASGLLSEPHWYPDNIEPMLTRPLQVRQGARGFSDEHSCPQSSAASINPRRDVLSNIGIGVPQIRSGGSSGGGLGGMISQSEIFNAEGLGHGRFAFPDHSPIDDPDADGSTASFLDSVGLWGLHDDVNILFQQ